MNIDINRSLIYDTINFFDIYFNYKKHCEKLFSLGIEKEKALLFYNIVYSNVNEVNKDLTAFFTVERDTYSLLMTFYTDNINEICVLDDLIERVEQDSFKQFFINYYFNYENKIIKNNEIYKLILSSDTKISITIILLNYKHLIDVLIEYLRKVHGLVSGIFLNNIDTINNFRLDNKHISFIENKIKQKFLENSSSSISLINPYEYLFEYFSEQKVYYSFLGYLCCYAIEQENKNIIVSLSSINDILYNEITTDILNAICSKQSIISTEIADIMETKNIPRSKTYRSLKQMLDNRIIYVSRRTNNYVFLSINNEYLLKAKSKVFQLVTYDEAEKFISKIKSFLPEDTCYKDIIEIISSDYALAILNIIRKNKQINSSQILQIIKNEYQCSSATIYRLLSMLLKNNVIYICKKYKNKIYYSISNEFFINAEKVISDLLHYFVDEKAEMKKYIDSKFNSFLENN